MQTNKKREEEDNETVQESSGGEPWGNRHSSIPRANELGIVTVSIYSKEDRYALFRSKADESYPLNPDKGPIDAYLDIDTIIKIALNAGVDAIHPGYGFLSENPEFVDSFLASLNSFSDRKSVV